MTWASGSATPARNHIPAGSDHQLRACAQPMALVVLPATHEPATKHLCTCRMAPTEGAYTTFPPLKTKAVLSLETQRKSTQQSLSTWAQETNPPKKVSTVV